MGSYERSARPSGAESLRRGGLFVLALLALAFAVCMSIEVYSEFYSEGPPYFGRRENMDKWETPLPWLAAVDGAIALFVGLIGWHLSRR